MWRLRQSNKIKEAILALHCSLSAFQQPIAENQYNDPLTAYFRRVSCPILQLTTIVSAIQSATNQGELFNISPACSKFLFCGFSNTAKVKIPTKIIQIPTTIMTCLFIFKLSLNLEFYKTNVNYMITSNMNVNFNLFLFQCMGSRLFETHAASAWLIRRYPIGVLPFKAWCALNVFYFSTAFRRSNLIAHAVGNEITTRIECLREKELGPFYNNNNPRLHNAEKQFMAVHRIVIAVNDGGTNIWEGQHWCHQPSCCNLSLSLSLGCCHATTIQSDTPQTFKPSKHQIQS